MTKKQVYFSVSGSDSNPGTYKSPKRSPESINTLGLKPGDEALFRQGDAFTPLGGSKLEANTFVLVKTNGVRFDSYATGTERSANPSFSHTGSKSVVWGFLGSDNEVQHLDVWNGETGIAVYQTHTGNLFDRVRVQQFGDGIVDKGSHTVIQNCYIAGGRMIVNTGAKTDYGSRALVLERIDKTTHTGTRIRNVFIEECLAPSLAFGVDGAGVEFYGMIEDVIIEGCFARRIKIMSEYGAVTSRKETIRDVLFRNNVIIGPLLYVNPSTDQFHADLEHVRYERNVIANDDPTMTPVFLGGPSWTNMSGKLSFSNNLMTSEAQMFKASAGSDVSTIERAGNVYQGGEVGLPLALTESIQDIPFVNAAASDYRLSREMLMPDDTPYVPGAWGLQIDEMALTTSVPLMRNLFTLKVGPGDEGKRCYVAQTRMAYELQPDLTTWLKVS